MRAWRKRRHELVLDSLPLSGAAVPGRHRHRLRHVSASGVLHRFRRPHYQPHRRPWRADAGGDRHGDPATARSRPEDAAFRGAAGRGIRLRAAVAQPGTGRDPRRRHVGVGFPRAAAGGGRESGLRRRAADHASVVAHAGTVLGAGSQIHQRRGVAAFGLAQRLVPAPGRRDPAIGDPCPARHRPGRASGRHHGAALRRHGSFRRPRRRQIGGSRCRDLGAARRLGERPRGHAGASRRLQAADHADAVADSGKLRAA